MRNDRRRIDWLIFAAAGALATGALATGASAATLSVTGRCYVIAGINAPAMQFSGRGYVPRDKVLVSTRDGTVDTTATADAAGEIAGTADAPTPFIATPSVKRVLLEAQDQTPTGATVVAHTTVMVTELGWTHGSTPPRPGYGAFTEKTGWMFSGFVPGEPIYGHYLSGGRQVAMARFGRAGPPCGTLAVRARLFPASPHHSGYTIQYDDSRRYSRRSRPRIIGSLKLTV